MTIDLVLTSDRERRLIRLAKDRGVTIEDLVTIYMEAILSAESVLPAIKSAGK